MGSSLNARAFLAVFLASMLAIPAIAQANPRTQKKKRAKAPAVRVVTPPAPRPKQTPAVTVPASALALSGTYTLTRIGTRPVRDPDLAASQVTFLPEWRVTGTTACNGFAGSLHTNRNASKIIGFDNLIATQMGCEPGKAQAEATTLRVLSQTANIARAGNTITLFNSVGIMLAQFTAVTPTNTASPSTSAVSAQRPLAAPQRVITGDYSLTELAGRPVGLRVPATIVPQPVSLPNTQFLTIVPTFYIRNGTQVSGMSGCNQFNATLETAADQTFRLGPVAATKKLCLDSPTQRTERDVLAAFRDAARVDVSQSTVSFLRADGTRLARFSTVAFTPSSAPNLQGKTWLLRRINNVAVGSDNPPSLVIENNRVSGYSGCNRISSSFALRDNQPVFGVFAMTRMACLDPQRATLERDYVEALRKTNAVSQTGSQLILTARRSGSILVFEAD